MPALSKNNGEILTTTQKGEFDALPAQLRSALTVVTTRQKVNLDGTPSALTGGVIESTTAQETTTERLKEVITASFPITLTSKVRTDEFGGGTVTVTDTYSLTEPTAPAGSLVIIDHGISNLGLIYHEHKEEKTTASWPLLNGQQYEDELDLIVQFTEQITTPDAQLGDARTEIIPIDNTKQRVRVWTVNTSGLEAYALKLAGTEDVQLPEVLVSVTAVANVITSNALSQHLVGDQGFAILNDGAGSLDPDARASASASAQVDLRVVRRQYWGQDVPVTYAYFFLAEDSCAQGDVLTRLAQSDLFNAAVNAWPVFKPESVTFTLKGQQASVSAQADSHAGLAMSTDTEGDLVSQTVSSRKGSGQSIEVGTSSRFLEIPPTLHGALNVAGTTTNTYTPTATVQANTTELYVNSIVVVPSITNEPTPTSKQIEYAVLPTSLSATSPTGIPTTGLYLRRVEIQPYRWGYCRVRATVIDMSIFA